ncbi:MAG: CHASE2 domain-containing protein, partial [Proteobacteria bacterium]|nr:CHASE2 domain-containing protein [Pseudomonadota bacterium]
MKKYLKRYDIWFAVLLFLVAIVAEYKEWFSTAENELLSLRHSFRFSYGDKAKTAFPYDKIVIVAQDDSYLEDYGVYPPKWADYAKMIRNIKLLGGKVIMVDFLFEFPSSYGEDPILAKSLREAGNTMMVATVDF